MYGDIPGASVEILMSEGYAFIAILSCPSGQNRVKKSLRSEIDGISRLCYSNSGFIRIIRGTEVDPR